MYYIPYKDIISVSVFLLSNNKSLSLLFLAQDNIKYRLWLLSRNAGAG
jgi:hypothetical protein